MPVYCVAFDVVGRRFITAGDDGIAKVWCIRTGRLIVTLRGHDDNVRVTTMGILGGLMACRP